MKVNTLEITMKDNVITRHINELNTCAFVTCKHFSEKKHELLLCVTDLIVYSPNTTEDSSLGQYLLQASYKNNNIHGVYNGILRHVTAFLMKHAIASYVCNIYFHLHLRTI